MISIKQLLYYDIRSKAYDESRDDISKFRPDVHSVMDTTIINSQNLYVCMNLIERFRNENN